MKRTGNVSAREFQRLSFMAENNLKMRSLQRGGSLFSRSLPKRNFNDGFERGVERLTEKLPYGNIGLAVVALNTIAYGLYLMWPPYNMFAYMNNFTFSAYGLHKGYFHSLLLCHFSHTSFFSYFLDSLIIGLLCQSLGMMHGNIFLAKGMVLSVLLGSFLLFMQSALQGGGRPYCGNDSILRGLIFSVIFANPAAKLTMIPIPIQVPAWAIAVLLLGMDLMYMNVAGFGGVAASYALVNALI